MFKLAWQESQSAPNGRPHAEASLECARSKSTDLAGNGNQSPLYLLSSGIQAIGYGQTKSGSMFDPKPDQMDLKLVRCNCWPGLLTLDHLSFEGH